MAASQLLLRVSDTMPNATQNTTATNDPKKPKIQTNGGRQRSASQSTDSSGEYTVKVVGPDQKEEDSPTMTISQYFAAQGKKD
ncbi:hypothetical protein EVJ58_g6831 [Rhodofomes roseus]|uniref:Uncharacterized protein n=1 Tax=Rhodofomes roseus TaxID=34475 RepID=A0A4Y9YA90_9APHY|nr:hypothetical protein EVJ58_g6831 [Rhodofomes roseus]